MSEQDYPRTMDPNEQKRRDILSITPPGQDPVLYWHQVSQDAIHARERNEEFRKANKDELERLRAYENSERQRVERDLYHQTMPSIRDLLNRVENGDFSFTMTLSFYPNIERKEG